MQIFEYFINEGITLCNNAEGSICYDLYEKSLVDIYNDTITNKYNEIVQSNPPGPFDSIAKLFGGLVIHSVYAQEQLLLILISGFEGDFANVTQQTGLNFLLVEHEDESISLYSWDNKTTTLGPDGLPDKLTPLAGYPIVESLEGANGVIDILSKIKYWDLDNR